VTEACARRPGAAASVSRRRRERRTLLAGGSRRASRSHTLAASQAFERMHTLSCFRVKIEAHRGTVLSHGRHVAGTLIHLLNSFIPEALQIASAELEPKDWERMVFEAHSQLRDNISPTVNQQKVLALVRASSIGVYYGATVFAVTVCEQRL
jgi:hypothetical protein